MDLESDNLPLSVLLVKSLIKLGMALFFKYSANFYKSSFYSEILSVSTMDYLVFREGFNLIKKFLLINIFMG